ncbi:Mrp/NBP35 family ATP-binding protein [Ruminococcaceae bacterium OttesenSCG-928-N02]|nr:Mrp/NBP35 family ATP-binding protein [Ruminococcaceae bacterium OttesenSCG-928-N02]
MSDCNSECAQCAQDCPSRTQEQITAENCDSNCASCGADCPSRAQPQSFLEAPNQYSHIENVIGVVSGKGGVGKSLVTSMLAVNMKRHGYATAVLDADVTGPSIPKAFGLQGHAAVDELGIYPADTSTGIKVMSVNLLLDNPEDPVLWRGPVIASAVKQFWQDVVWREVDYMFVDMPPGTGDVPLTVFQSLPLNGIVVVTSPQELVSMVVEKAVKMAELMNVPILGLVENMSYFECPHCEERVPIFGESHVDEIAQKYGIPVLARIPVNPQIATAVDAGAVEMLGGNWLDDAVKELEKLQGNNGATPAQ